MKTLLPLLITTALLLVPGSGAWAAPSKSNVSSVRIKELVRIATAHDNSLVGYGIVTGLAGTGDTSRSAGTVQSISNLLRRFGVNVLPAKLHSRNVAGVMVTATLGAFMHQGDKLDINVTSLGDARSLLGGTLLLTHLNGPDGKIYALAQGPLSVGGFKYDLFGNVVQKNHPTAATITSGATVERDIDTRLRGPDGSFEYILVNPNFTTATRIAEALNRELGNESAKVLDAGRVVVSPPSQGEEMATFLMRAENVMVKPDQRAMVVVNERTGTVVSGGDVRISQTTISHGNLKVSISTEYYASQPFLVRDTGVGVQTVVLPETTIEVEEEAPQSVSMPDGTTVADLVMALTRVHASSRDIIVILQGIKRAGALHAELVIQ
ncbi:flagellar basal body P-ring protein FlgI [Myxococcota bacterium]|nr:flagellar basal body P-ring protein FlgI [Myxococcota bacterium]